ncbi:hypothetical protein [Leadbetterella sp. DM7]|uniref:hypothetical protein n=1 Tax=Leadbetterella sp. DM7 TaxID=3235085 RepID=UPI00349EEEDD
MKKAAFLSILFLNIACGDQRPGAKCPDAGPFVMTLKNEPGRIAPDSTGKNFYLYFSTEGSLTYTMRAAPCNLGKEFRAEVNVFFDGDFYKTRTGSAGDYIVYIRDMDYR